MMTLLVLKRNKDGNCEDGGVASAGAEQMRVDCTMLVSPVSHKGNRDSRFRKVRLGCLHALQRQVPGRYQGRRHARQVASKPHDRHGCLELSLRCEGAGLSALNPLTLLSKKENGTPA